MRPLLERVTRIASRMERAVALMSLTFYFVWGSLLIGCASRATAPIGSPPGFAGSVGASGGPTISSGASAACAGGTAMNIREPSIYLVQASHYPLYSVLVFSRSASGDTLPTAEIPGSLVSLDDAGDVFVLAQSGACIVEYPSASSAGSPARFLPVGPGTKISAVKDMVVSHSGEIFVSDGTGIAVFSATATGDADPLRYILGVTQGGAPISPVAIAVDRQDNLYVDEGNSSVAVFGPAANGSQVPSRTIETGARINFGMSTDYSGNLYVLCLYPSADGSRNNEFGVLEFDPRANGEDQPIRSFTSPAMYPWSGGPDIAVDSAGVIYITAGPPLGGTQTVFEFSADASGSVSPINTVTSSTVWTDTLVSSIVVH